MDAIDKRILYMLAENSDATATDIGSAVSLSVPAVNKRISRLKQDGVIRNSTIVTDAKKLNKTVTAFVFVVMEFGDNIRSLLEYAASDKDVLECYSITGEYDYVLKICAKDIEALEEKILTVKRKKGVMKSHTMISLMEHKFSPTILPDGEESI